MAKYPTGCPDCGGILIKEDGEMKCLGCGRPVLSHLERKRYYEQHKDEILHDIKKLGANATRKKWQIPSGTMTGLKTRWLPLEEQKPSRERPQPANNTLPRLPDFNENWTENVQIKWLDIWLYLATR